MITIKIGKNSLDTVDNSELYISWSMINKQNKLRQFGGNFWFQ